MRASNKRLVTDGDGLRASDAERDHAIGELRDRYAEGRLSHETFLHRMDVALRAKDRSELSGLFADLPGHGRAQGSMSQAVTGGLATLWQALRHRLAAIRGRTRAAWAGTPASLTAAPEQLATPLAAMSGAGPGSPGAGRFLPAEPLSLCLPRQVDGRFTIGRAPSCDFTVADLSVSRWHARLQHEEGSWLLSDLGSTNGTRLNGWRVTSAVPVQPGDSVSFGSAEYVIIERPVAAARPSGPD